MKTKFKFLAIAALGLALGFSSCAKEGNGETNLPEGQKKVNIRMNFANSKTRAEGNVTADNTTPNFTDLTLIFVGNSVVQKVAPLAASDKADLTTGKSFTVPNAVTKVYAIGNYGASGVSEGDTEASVKALAMQVDLQTDYMEVNLSGGMGGDDKDEAFTGAGFTKVDGTETATLGLYPAFARYEIKKVSAAPSSVVEQPLKSFKLTGIYITNTYRTIGLDYSSVATAAEDVFNFGPGTSNFDTSVPTYHKDTWTNASRTAAAEFVPEITAGEDGLKFWHYMVAPPIAGKGTSLAGNTATESSVPIIVLKIEDALADGDEGNSAEYEKVNYISVRKLIDSNNNALTFLRPGYVYKIANIAFGGEHLTVKPGDNTERSVAVQVTFHKWIGEDVTPEL